jgi:hypothetical protein
MMRKKSPTIPMLLGTNPLRIRKFLLHYNLLPLL